MGSYRCFRVNRMNQEQIVDRFSQLPEEIRLGVMLPFSKFRLYYLTKIREPKIYLTQEGVINIAGPNHNFNTATFMLEYISGANLVEVRD